MSDPGDGGLGHSWFAIELVSVEEPQAPVDTTGAGGLEGGFTGPVVPRPVAFRFRGKLKGPRIEPYHMKVNASISVVKTVERVLPGKARAVREVTFSVSGFRDPAYRWEEVLRDDDELLAILYAR